jgi:hypothetical protein
MSRAVAGRVKATHLRLSTPSSGSGGPLFASFVGAERYSLTESGRQALLEA